MKVSKKLKKLKGRTLGELRSRGAQSLSAHAERYGLSGLVEVPSDATFFKLLDCSRVGQSQFSAEGLVRHFRRRGTPPFFEVFTDRSNSVEALRRKFGKSAEEGVIEHADRIVAGCFDLLGFQDLSFGTPIDWHFEPLSGIVAPRLHWTRIDYLDPNQAGDVKIIWELNRHQYFAALGRAYWLTRDEVYAETFVSHVNSWIESNPPKTGINWASNLEVAFRSISWIWALYFFKDSKHLTPSLFVQIMKLLYVHGRHLETYLSTYFSPNTHLTGEALGLFYLGTLLPEFHCAERWRSTGSQILLGELDRHIRADGVYFEQSSYYHRYTADFYIHFLILSERNRVNRDTNLESKLRALLDHLMYITRPDGTTPLFGDDDGGRLVMLEERAANDFRALLSTGATLFGRPDYKYVAAEAAEETLWLLGSEGLQAFDELDAHQPSEQSTAFQESGYYVMRDGWSRESNFLLLDCGPHGSLRYGHAHADALAFDLAAHGRTVLVDPGTYTYTGSAEWRDYFRSSAAHNALSIDGESSSVPDGPFSWKHVAEAQALSWISRSRFDYFAGKHNGYERLPSPVKHTRSILFIKGDYWVVRDRVVTDGTHRYELNFHFAIGTNPRIETYGEDVMIRERPDELPGLEVVVSGGNGRWFVKEGWVSNSYAQRAAAPVCTFELQATGAQEFVTFLFPRRAADGKICVRELAANGRQAFEIRDGATHDLLLLGEGLTEAADVASDFELSWIRLAAGTSNLEELVLLNGRRLSLGGQEIVDSSEFISYVSARRSGHELRGETDRITDWNRSLPDWQEAGPQLLKQ